MASAEFDRTAIRPGAWMPALGAPEKKPNLWTQAIAGFWSDPANLIGPPGALVRRLFKCGWMLLSVYILIWVAAPLQVASWQLWMTDDVLAARVGWSFTLASALGFAIVRYAADATQPMRVPLLVPIVEFEERRYKGWSVKPAHLHLPVPTVMLGAVMVTALFGISLLGLWNLYLHDQQTTGGASVAALSGSTDRVAEAQRTLDRFEVQTAAALAIVDQGIRETSAGSPTGRSRLVRQRTELMQGAAQTRRELQAELRTARAETVTTHQAFSDPRPVDAQVAGATGMARPLTASVLDLLRSAVVEMLLVMGAALGLVGSTSRIGVPAGGDVRREPETVETVTPTDVSAESSEPPPPPKRRYTLPVATPDDYARAAVVGPAAWARAEAEAALAEPSMAEEPAAPDMVQEAETLAGDDPGALAGAFEPEPPMSADPVDPVDPAEIDPLLAVHLADEPQPPPARETELASP